MTTKDAATERPWVGFNDQGKLVAIMPAMRAGDVCTFDQSPNDADARLILEAVNSHASLLARNAELTAGLDAAIRAANLALFVIRKENVMPNSNWESGFEGDMKIARAAIGKART